MTRNTPPSTPHPVAPAGDEPMQRRRTVAQAQAEGLTVYAGRPPHVRRTLDLDRSESLESVRETYWADEAEKLRAENERLRELLTGLDARADQLMQTNSIGMAWAQAYEEAIAALAPQPGSESQKKGDG